MQSEVKITIIERLIRIKNFLILNVDFIPTKGFEEGKLGVCVFLFKYAVYFQDNNVFEVASKLFDEIAEEINIHEQITFRRGLAGYGYGIVSLIADEIVEAEDSGVLSEIDEQIFSRLHEADNASNSDGLLGIGRYLAFSAITIQQETVNELPHYEVLDKISKELLTSQPLASDRKPMIEFLTYLIALNINVPASEKKLKAIISNPTQKVSPSVLLENYQRSKIGMLKEAANEMITEFREIPAGNLAAFKSSSTLLEAFISVNYLMQTFPDHDYSAASAYWTEKFLSGPASSIAKFDIDREVQNFRMFNGYANLGTELLKFLNFTKD